ncbi:hypothetical protein CC79DRAFT_438011 [Sarocladium strictum]
MLMNDLALFLSVRHLQRISGCQQASSDGGTPFYDHTSTSCLAPHISSQFKLHAGLTPVGERPKGSPPLHWQLEEAAFSVAGARTNPAPVLWSVRSNDVQSNRQLLNPSFGPLPPRASASQRTLMPQPPTSLCLWAQECIFTSYSVSCTNVLKQVYTKGQFRLCATC